MALNHQLITLEKYPFPINIGVDVIEINRFRNKPITENQNLYDKIFHDNEMKYCLKYRDPYPHLAGIFAAKEAIIKCLETKISIKNIEILRKKKKPIATVYSKSNSTIRISISHTKDFALAMATSYNNYPSD